MKFKIIAAIVIIVVILFAVLVGTAIRNSANSEGAPTEEVQQP